MHSPALQTRGIHASGVLYRSSVRKSEGRLHCGLLSLCLCHLNTRKLQHAHAKNHFSHNNTKIRTPLQETMVTELPFLRCRQVNEMTVLKLNSAELNKNTLHVFNAAMNQTCKALKPWWKREIKSGRSRAAFPVLISGSSTIQGIANDNKITLASYLPTTEKAGRQKRSMIISFQQMCPVHAKDLSQI